MLPGRSPGFVALDPAIMGQLPGLETGVPNQGIYLWTGQEGGPWLMGDGVKAVMFWVVTTGSNQAFSQRICI